MFTACGGASPPAEAAAGPADTPSEEASSASEAGGGEPASASKGAAPEEDEEEPLGQEPVGGGKSSEFVLTDSGGSAKEAHGATPSKIKATKTHAAMKFIVVDKEKQEPIPGIVISLTDPQGTKFFTEETDATGYAEVLVPVARKYELVYLSLGQRDIAASVDVTAEANQNIRLTLRYKGYQPPTKSQHFVLDGVEFDTGKATIRPESFPRLDRVVEYMMHKKKSRIEISGHTDNVGNPANNQKLSEKRAQACRDYIVSKGIDASRVQAVGYGDKRPVATNDTAEGRQANRRIEATEL